MRALRTLWNILRNIDQEGISVVSIALAMFIGHNRFKFWRFPHPRNVTEYKIKFNADGMVSFQSPSVDKTSSQMQQLLKEDLNTSRNAD